MIIGLAIYLGPLGESLQAGTLPVPPPPGHSGPFSSAFSSAFGA